MYSFNPIPEELNEEETKYVLGVQGNIWTEYMKTSKQVEYMAFPRILAMSEVVWSKQKNKNYPDFVKRVENFHERLDALKINYANHLYEIEGKLLSDNNGLRYQLQTLTDGKTIRFTLNDSEPTVNSEAYTRPIPITESVRIKASVFNSSEKLGNTFSQNINLHKAVGKKITINKEPHKSYLGSGAQGLINGISGSDTRYGDKEWLGFWGEDIEIIIDLGKETNINTIETRFYNGQGQWIYAPKEIEFGFDAHGLVSKVKLPEVLDKIQPVIIKADVLSRHIYLKIPNYGFIPEGKQGAGNKAWTFIDELIVN